MEQCEGLGVGSKLPVFKDQAFPACLSGVGMAQGKGQPADAGGRSDHCGSRGIVQRP